LAYVKQIGKLTFDPVPNPYRICPRLIGPRVV
jgi:hypothetical protein